MRIIKLTHVIAGAFLAFALLWSPSQALALEDKLVIVTSYPPDTTVTVKKANGKLKDVEIYLTPINIDPESPAMPISHPLVYSIYLAKLHGPFATLEGIFKGHRGRTRSLLLLEILGRETAVEIDSRLLQPVS